MRDAGFLTDGVRDAGEGAELEVSLRRAGRVGQHLTRGRLWGGKARSGPGGGWGPRGRVCSVHVELGFGRAVCPTWRYSPEGQRHVDGVQSQDTGRGLPGDRV